MDNTHKMKRLHTTIPENVYQQLENIREKHGFPSINRSIEYLVMKESFEKRIDTLISVIEGRNVHKQHTAEEDKPKSYVGFCSKYCSKEKQKVVAVRYIDPNGHSKEESLCKKHYLELSLHQREHGGKLELI